MRGDGSRRTRMNVGVIGVALAATMALLLPGQVGASLPAVDHFQCWLSDLSHSEPARVRVNDGVINTRAEVRQPRMLCAPVEKERFKDGTTPIQHPDHHLTMYNMAAEETDQVLAFYGNQFEEGILLTEGPSTLLVPTRKQPHLRPSGLDHYQCYEVVKREGGDPDEVVRLTDEFRSREARVGPAAMFCAPARKRHGDRIFEPENQGAALVCYRTERLELNVARQADVRTQFGKHENVKVHTGRMLCVPSFFKHGLANNG